MANFRNRTRNSHSFSSISSAQSDDGEDSDGEEIFPFNAIHEPNDEFKTSNSSFKSDSNTVSNRYNSKVLDQNILLAKSILHLDVDCFYCQCEELKQPELSQRPLAIGQKHIVVTCNYVARSMGVKKLMLRSDAKRICPNLVVMEGSDLEPYRKDSRKIYLAFRRAVKGLLSDVGASMRNVGVERFDCNENSVGGICCTGNELQVKKGGMDEMYADISFAVNFIWKRGKDRSNYDKCEHSSDKLFSLPQHAFVYGSSTSTNVVSISEDQSGLEARIIALGRSNSIMETDGLLLNGVCGSRPEDVTRWGSLNERELCVERLRIAAVLAERVRESVRSATGFSTCVGVSVSPMLAKIASDLKKPNSLNILYPWRSSSIIEEMPLRRIPDLGSKTLKSLVSSLEKYNNRKADNIENYWRCRDLLNVPQNAIISCLSVKNSFGLSSEQNCNLFLNRCKGIDTISIVDDNGGLSKTVSVEDSFIRGSTTSHNAVSGKLKTLLPRLYRLLKERRDNSDKPGYAYPTVLRLTIRNVDTSVSGRRPFSTRCKQCHFDGKNFISVDSESKRDNILSRAVDPLLEQLLHWCSHQNGIDVTRLNLAVTNFADVIQSSYNSSNESGENFAKNQQSVTQYYQRQSLKRSQNNRNSNQIQDSEGRLPTSRHTTKQICSTVRRSKNDRESRQRNVIDQSTSKSCNNKKVLSDFFVKKKLNDETPMKRNLSEMTCSGADTEESRSIRNMEQLPASLDHDVLLELPTDIAAEVIENHRFYNNVTEKYKRQKKGGIEHFFSRKP